MSDPEEKSDESDDDDDDATEMTADGIKVTDSSRKKPHGCNVKDGRLHGDHTILLTKIDVSAGAFGMYNFYRMQVWKERHKDLWILFTNWGRIGNYGQYQNTPYGSAKQAEDEFRKIFKVRSFVRFHALFIEPI